MATPTSLVGSVVERKTRASVPTPPKLKGTGSTGFPTAKHRSQSAFARARNDARKTDGAPRTQRAPAVETLEASSSSAEPPAEPDDAWRRQAEEENQRRVESMSDEERERERTEILERFGPNIAEVLRKAREVREDKSSEQMEGGLSIDTTLKSPKTEHRVIKSAMASRPSSPPPGSPGSSRPSSRTDRRLRFAELTPRDVHVYESAPPSPRKKALALPPPMPEDGPTVSLGSLGVVAKLPDANGDYRPVPIPDPQLSTASKEDQANVEEGTPEYIRHHFFPSATPHNPSLAWIEGAEDSATGLSDSTLRFDLAGNPIPLDVSSSLPTHLGLHHHAEGSHAGYTLDDLFLLSRSTVPAQRASMLDVLGRIARRISRAARNRGTGMVELKGKEADLRKRILAAGVEAMTERGTLGTRAIEVIWVCIVAWDEDLISVEDVELKDFSMDGALLSVPLDYVLPQISSAFTGEALPQESLGQLLAIIHRLAQESNDVATSVAATESLLANIVHAFLLTPYPPETDSPLPDPFAIQVLTTLASSSRSNASTVLAVADALLRFVITPPSHSPYPLPLAISLLTSTFHLYTTLASYGLYAHTAATIQEHLHQIRQFILSDECQSTQLRGAWLCLLEGWIVCARDPHMTTPDHAMLWSQVVGWGWADDVLALRQKLTSEQPEIWAALWRTLTAWLEGASVNGVKGGEAEKNLIITSVRDRFVNGPEHSLIENCVRELANLLQSSFTGERALLDLQCLARQSNVLSSAIRLWLSCLPSSSQQGLDAPPFSLPFSQISALCGRLATHPLWKSAFSDPNPSVAHVYLRSLSQLLSAYLDMSNVLPGRTDDLWIAQALTILPRLLPGSEEFAIRTIAVVTNLVNPGFTNSHSWPVPAVIWERKGLEPVLPLLVYSLRAARTRVGAAWMTPHSISTSTTQRLPPLSSCRSEHRTELPLPLHKDWLLSPLDYLLRSGQTQIFKSLPSSWDASEVDLVRALLLLARIAREVLAIHGLSGFTMSRSEVIFGCMKVFMLEHEQQQETVTSSEEVFRDSIVNTFMNDLLASFTIAPSSSRPTEVTVDDPPLDVIATRFLGPSTPFYQYYTDFVGLYDAISFSHPLFSRLLLPPLSMRYSSDYRKYLWVDYGHVVRTIKTPIEEVVSESLEEFLWPVETDSEIITGYLRAATKGDLEGFVRLVATHHIACNIWPDLRAEDAIEERNEKAMKLLKAVVSQSGFDAVREIVYYRQTRVKSLLPPHCFEQDGDWKEARRAFVNQCAADVKDQLKNLL